MSESSDPTEYQRAQERRFEAYLDVVVRIRRLRAEHRTADNGVRLRQLLAERQELLRIQRLEEDRHHAAYRARMQELDAEYQAVKAERPEGWEGPKIDVDLPQMALAALKMANAVNATNDIVGSMGRKRAIQ